MGNSDATTLSLTVICDAHVMATIGVYLDVGMFSACFARCGPRQAGSHKGPHRVSM